MKRIALLITIIIILIFSSSCVNNSFNKDITDSDIELYYTVYEESCIAIEINPLVNIKDFKVKITYYKKDNLDEQSSEWIKIDSLTANNKYYLSDYNISYLSPYDRVALSNLSGKKNGNDTEFNEIKRVGIIKAPIENIDTSLFSLRLDTSTKNSSSYGRLYITSAVNLWDIHFEITEAFSNQMWHTYIPNDVKKMEVNEEIYIELRKMISDTGIIDHVSIMSAKGRTKADTYIYE